MAIWPKEELKIFDSAQGGIKVFETRVLFLTSPFSKSQSKAHFETRFLLQEQPFLHEGPYLSPQPLNYLSPWTFWYPSPVAYISPGPLVHEPGGFKLAPT
jgi:hypothetical protein